jgi:hypothetical protein
MLRSELLHRPAGDAKWRTVGPLAPALLRILRAVQRALVNSSENTSAALPHATGQQS